MSEILQNVLTAALVAAIPALVAVAGILARKAVRYLAEKTGTLREQAVQDAIVAAAELAVESVMQTAVDTIKHENAGKLPATDAVAARNQAKLIATKLLDATTVAGQPVRSVPEILLDTALEAAVHRLKGGLKSALKVRRG